MVIQQLEKLANEHQSIADAIRLTLQQFDKKEELTVNVKKAIKRTYKRKHWTQRPENQARLKKIIKKMNDTKRKK